MGIRWCNRRTWNAWPHGAANWEAGIVKAKKPWGGVAEAGPGTTTSIEVDDRVEEAALAYIKAAADKDRPWCLNVGFIAPHFPLVVPRRFWDL